MNKEKARIQSPRRRVKGTVLFTVVCVMMVLIVFLMGTLALAATANKRANFKYQKAQNETIARTVMESVIKSISDDNTTTGIRNSIVTASPFDISVSLDGRTYPVTVSKHGTHSWYDGGQWLTGDVFEITARVASVGGNEETVYTASMVLGTQVNNTNPNVNTGGKSGAFVSFGGISGTIGTQGMTTGGTEIGLDRDGTDNYTLDNYAAQEMPFYVNGNLTTASGCYAVCNALGDKANGILSYIAVTGDFTINNAGYAMEFDPTVNWDSATTLNYYDIPTVYVGKKLNALSGNFSFGNDNVPVNVYAGSMTSDIHFFHKGDIYLFDENETSVFNGSQGVTRLYRWAERNVTGPDGNTKKHSFGNIYSRGNVTFNLGNQFNNDILKASRQRQGSNVEYDLGRIDVDGGWTHNIDGDVRVAKELKITGTNGGIKIGGDAVASVVNVENSKLWVGGDLYATTLKLNGDLQVDGEVYAKNIEGTGTITCTKLTTKSAIGGGPGQANITLTGMFSNGEKNYPTSIYPDGYTQQEIITNIISVPNKTKYENPTDYPSTLTDFNKKITVLDTNGNLIVPTVTGNAAGHITSSCVLSGDYNDNVYIDTTVNSAAIAVICDNAQFQSGKSIVINENKGNVYFFVKSLPGGQSWQSGLGIKGGSIITTDYIKKMFNKDLGNSAADVTWVKSANLKWDGTKIPSMEIKCNPPATGAGSEDFPYVYVYGEQGARMSVSNDSLIVANIRAPKMDYTQAKAAKVNNGDVVKHYGAVTTEFKGSSNDYIGVIGQLISNTITVGNEWGLVFVEDPTAGSSGNNPPPVQPGNLNPGSVYYAHSGSINYNIY